MTIYPRITMPEGKKYLESRELNGLKRPNSVTSNFSAYSRPRRESVELIVSDGRELQEQIDAVRAEIDAQSKRARLDVFFQYFSEWRHLRTLIGTASTWFLMDVAFYGTNLNQSVILTDIGFSKGRNEYETLKRNAIGNLIIAVAGYVPGYFVTIFFIEKLGRRWIQIQGFVITALMFAVLAGDYAHLGTGGKFVCLAIAQVRSFLSCRGFPRTSPVREHQRPPRPGSSAHRHPPTPTIAQPLLTPPRLLRIPISPFRESHLFDEASRLVKLTPGSPQFFFNFGPNATTFIVPAEVFPSRVRGFGHGVSAATGKLGAILSSLLFNYLSGTWGLQNVLWIYFACQLIGAIVTWFTIPETRWKDADVTDYEEWFEANVTERRRGGGV